MIANNNNNNKSCWVTKRNYPTTLNDRNNKTNLREMNVLNGVEG